ncbi:hypothetical protein PG995_008739 [Apiospora arundinis]
MPARNDTKTNGGGGGDRTGTLCLRPLTDDGVSDQAKTDKEPPWYDWKIARVLAEAAIEKEAVENLEAGKAAAEEKRRAELGGSKPQ